MKLFIVSIFLLFFTTPFLIGKEISFYRSNAWADKIEITYDKNLNWLLKEEKESEAEILTLYYKGELFYTLEKKSKGNFLEETYYYPNGTKRKKLSEENILKENILKEESYKIKINKELITYFYYEENSYNSYKRDITKKIEKDSWSKISFLEEENKKLFFQENSLISLFPLRVKIWEWSPYNNKISFFSPKGNLISQENNLIENNGEREKIRKTKTSTLKEFYSPLGLLEREEKQEKNNLIFYKNWQWSPSLLLLSYEENEGELIKKVIFSYKDNIIVKESIFINNQIRQIINWEKTGKKVENFNRKGEKLDDFFILKE